MTETEKEAERLHGTTGTNYDAIRAEAPIVVPERVAQYLPLPGIATE